MPAAVHMTSVSNAHLVRGCRDASPPLSCRLPAIIGTLLRFLLCSLLIVVSGGVAIAGGISAATVTPSSPSSVLFNARTYATYAVAAPPWRLAAAAEVPTAQSSTAAGPRDSNSRNSIAPAPTAAVVTYQVPLMAELPLLPLLIGGGIGEGEGLWRTCSSSNSSSSSRSRVASDAFKATVAAPQCKGRIGASGGPPSAASVAAISRYSAVLGTALRGESGGETSRRGKGDSEGSSVPIFSDAGDSLPLPPLPLPPHLAAYAPHHHRLAAWGAHRPGLDPHSAAVADGRGGLTDASAAGGGEAEGEGEGGMRTSSLGTYASAGGTRWLRRRRILGNISDGSKKTVADGGDPSSSSSSSSSAASAPFAAQSLFADYPAVIEVSGRAQLFELMRGGGGFDLGAVDGVGGARWAAAHERNSSSPPPRVSSSRPSAPFPLPPTSVSLDASSSLWLLLYYDSRCGHCHQFAPFYGAFSSEAFGRPSYWASLASAAAATRDARVAAEAAVTRPTREEGHSGEEGKRRRSGYDNSINNNTNNNDMISNVQSKRSATNAQLNDGDGASLHAHVPTEDGDVPTGDTDNDAPPQPFLAVTPKTRHVRRIASPLSDAAIAFLSSKRAKRKGRNNKADSSSAPHHHHRHHRFPPFAPLGPNAYGLLSRNVLFAAVNCAVHTAACEEEGVLDVPAVEALAFSRDVLGEWGGDERGDVISKKKAKKTFAAGGEGGVAADGSTTPTASLSTTAKRQQGTSEAAEAWNKAYQGRASLGARVVTVRIADRPLTVPSSDIEAGEEDSVPARGTATAVANLLNNPAATLQPPPPTQPRRRSLQGVKSEGLWTGKSGEQMTSTHMSSSALSLLLYPSHSFIAYSVPVLPIMAPKQGAPSVEEANGNAKESVPTAVAVAVAVSTAAGGNAAAAAQDPMASAGPGVGANTVASTTDGAEGRGGPRAIPKDAMLRLLLQQREEGSEADANRGQPPSSTTSPPTAAPTAAVAAPIAAVAPITFEMHAVAALQTLALTVRPLHIPPPLLLPPHRRHLHRRSHRKGGGGQRPSSPPLDDVGKGHCLHLPFLDTAATTTSSHRIVSASPLHLHFAAESLFAPSAARLSPMLLAESDAHGLGQLGRGGSFPLPYQFVNGDISVRALSVSSGGGGNGSSDAFSKGAAAAVSSSPSSSVSLYEYLFSEDRDEESGGEEGGGDESYSLTAAARRRIAALPPSLSYVITEALRWRSRSAATVGGLANSSPSNANASSNIMKRKVMEGADHARDIVEYDDAFDDEENTFLKVWESPACGVIVRPGRRWGASSPQTDASSSSSSSSAPLCLVGAALRQKYKAEKQTRLLAQRGALSLVNAGVEAAMAAMADDKLLSSLPLNATTRKHRGGALVGPGQPEAEGAEDRAPTESGSGRRRLVLRPILFTSLPYLIEGSRGEEAEEVMGNSVEGSSDAGRGGGGGDGSGEEVSGGVHFSSPPPLLPPPRLPQSIPPQWSLHRQDIANALFYTLWTDVPLAPRTDAARRALHRFLGAVGDLLPWTQVGALLSSVDTAPLFGSGEGGSSSSSTSFASVVAWRARLVAAGLSVVSLDGAVAPNITAGDILLRDSLKWSTCREGDFGALFSSGAHRKRRVGRRSSSVSPEGATTVASAKEGERASARPPHSRSSSHSHSDSHYPPSSSRNGFGYAPYSRSLLRSQRGTAHRGPACGLWLLFHTLVASAAAPAGSEAYGHYSQPFSYVDEDYTHHPPVGAANHREGEGGIVGDADADAEGEFFVSPAAAAATTQLPEASALPYADEMFSIVAGYARHFASRNTCPLCGLYFGETSVVGAAGVGGLAAEGSAAPTASTPAEEGTVGGRKGSGGVGEVFSFLSGQVAFGGPVDGRLLSALVLPSLAAEPLPLSLSSLQGLPPSLSPPAPSPSSSPRLASDGDQSATSNGANTHTRKYTRTRGHIDATAAAVTFASISHPSLRLWALHSALSRHARVDALAMALRQLADWAAVYWRAAAVVEEDAREGEMEAGGAEGDGRDSGGRGGRSDERRAKGSISPPLIAPIALSVSPLRLKRLLAGLLGASRSLLPFESFYTATNAESLHRVSSIGESAFPPRGLCVGCRRYGRRQHFYHIENETDSAHVKHRGPSFFAFSCNNKLSMWHTLSERFAADVERRWASLQTDRIVQLAEQQRGRDEREEKEAKRGREKEKGSATLAAAAALARSVRAGTLRQIRAIECSLGFGFSGGTKGNVNENRTNENRTDATSGDGNPTDDGSSQDRQRRVCSGDGGRVRAASVLILRRFFATVLGGEEGWADEAGPPASSVGACSGNSQQLLHTSPLGSFGAGSITVAPMGNSPSGPRDSQGAEESPHTSEYEFAWNAAALRHFLLRRYGGGGVAQTDFSAARLVAPWAERKGLQRWENAPAAPAVAEGGNAERATANVSSSNASSFLPSLLPQPERGIEAVDLLRRHDAAFFEDDSGGGSGGGGAVAVPPHHLVGFVKKRIKGENNANGGGGGQPIHVEDGGGERAAADGGAAQVAPVALPLGEANRNAEALLLGGLAGGGGVGRRAVGDGKGGKGIAAVDDEGITVDPRFIDPRPKVPIGALPERAVVLYHGGLTPRNAGGSALLCSIVVFAGYLFGRRAARRKAASQLLSSAVGAGGGGVLGQKASSSKSIPNPHKSTAAVHNGEGGDAAAVAISVQQQGLVRRPERVGGGVVGGGGGVHAGGGDLAVVVISNDSAANAVGGPSDVVSSGATPAAVPSAFWGVGGGAGVGRRSPLPSPQPVPYHPTAATSLAGADGVVVVGSSRCPTATTPQQRSAAGSNSSSHLATAPSSFSPQQGGHGGAAVAFTAAFSAAAGAPSSPLAPASASLPTASFTSIGCKATKQA